MCLAFPSLVVKVEGDFGKVDFGGGTMRDGINLSQVRPRVGDLVLVHAGYAIQILDELEAARTIEYWEANINWKCDRCSLLHECPQGSIYLEKKERGNLLTTLPTIRRDGGR